jgi:hypothetical protein
MTTNSQHNETRLLSDAELDAVNGGTIAMMDSWTVLQNQLSADYARPPSNPYNWGHF